MPIALHYAARTDIGVGSKTRNEDSGYAGPDLLVLADGMGGHAAGDVASSTVVGELVELDGVSLGADDAQDQLRSAVIRANSHLRQAMDGSEDLDGMGTTCIALLRAGNNLVVANIGDSRAFLMRDGKLTQITKDHSFVQALLDDGRITAEEAEHHPQRNMVTRVLTGREDDEPDLSLREGKIGDRYLLCSDGLSDYVAKSSIQEVMAKAETPAEAADRLIDMALRGSTRDNVTVVIADVVDQANAPSNHPEVVGAAADLHTAPHADETQLAPQTPAAKAAALRREANQQPPASPPPAGGPEGAGPPAPSGPQLAEEASGSRQSTRFRWGLLAGVIVLILAVAAFVGYRWSQQQYYVASQDGYVTIHQGIPQDLGPLSLHSVDTKTDIPVSELPPIYRKEVREGISVDDRPDAISTAERLRGEMVRCQSGEEGSGCTP
ncbi:PP2C family protein-serine/threonine phosphatase [Demetria terragena]|uniref:PP2C family protein-serine/threonine phosphatase n=1 Tax=Demetria terragena TaxID=63959 RepID=UPI00038131B7|nr:PP2C family serine/threonine-protein phosphatase [Demetria terragena]